MGVGSTTATSQFDPWEEGTSMTKPHWLGLGVSLLKYTHYLPDTHPHHFFLHSKNLLLDALAQATMWMLRRSVALTCATGSPGTLSHLADGLGTRVSDVESVESLGFGDLTYIIGTYTVYSCK